MDIYEKMRGLHIPYIRGYYEAPARSLFYRKALAMRRHYEEAELPEHEGTYLYPAGRVERYARYLTDIMVTPEEVALQDPEAAEIWGREPIFQYTSEVPWEHMVGGNMWTHSIPNYERILSEGFDSYFSRIERIADADMREGLVHLLTGIKAYHRRCVAYLRRVGAAPALIDALERVPFAPAETAYEAMVCINFVFYLDNADDPGALAGALLPYYRGEDMVPWLREFYGNVDACDGFSMQLGASDDPRLEPIMIQCIQAIHGRRRPSVELFVDENTTPQVWDAAIAAIRSGATSPSFYNKQAYKKGFAERFPSIRREDLDRLCGGGCTEMMIAGYSNVGSLDAGINLAYILTECIETQLPSAPSFEHFYETLMGSIEKTVAHVTDCIARSQLQRAKYDPLPMRTLLVDDCIDTGVEFNAGGARYKWSVVNLAGIVNVIDSLLVIRDMVFSDGTYTGAQMAALLSQSDAVLLARGRNHKTRHGIDDPQANAMSYDFTKRLFGFFRDKKPAIGEGFLPSSIQFLAYVHAGSYVGATPDGRCKGAPLADSLAAVFAKDTEGPTALLHSVASMDLGEALGTPILNFTVNPSVSDRVFRGLIEGYFRMGGMQIQITCVSKETLQKAYEHPEDYKNLIIRLGGYSEYFYRLNDQVKRTIIERTVY